MNCLKSVIPKERKSSFPLQSGLEQGKMTGKIEGIILKLYEYSGSYPRPEQWLDRCAAVYTEEEAAEA